MNFCWQYRVNYKKKEFNPVRYDLIWSCQRVYCPKDPVRRRTIKRKLKVNQSDRRCYMMSPVHDIIVVPISDPYKGQGRKLTRLKVPSRSVIRESLPSRYLLFPRTSFSTMWGFETRLWQADRVRRYRPCPTKEFDVEPSCPQRKPTRKKRSKWLHLTVFFNI